MRALLDTQALVWFVEGAPLSQDALLTIAQAQAAETLYVSPITAWEVALASNKPNPVRRPNLQGLDPAIWFRTSVRATGAKIIPIKQRIALEACCVPALIGHGDPGDCFLVATARVGKMAIVTSDDSIKRLTTNHAGYLTVVPC